MAQPVLKAVKKIETETIAPELVKRIERAVRKIFELIDTIYPADIVQKLNEYFMSETVTLFAEWLIIDERFENQAWARAYRIKLAEDFFLMTAQLCISLRRILMDGKETLINLPPQEQAA